MAPLKKSGFFGVGEAFRFVKVHMVRPDIRENDDIPYLRFPVESDLATEKHITLQAEVSQQRIRMAGSIHFMAGSIPSSEQERIRREFLFPHSEGKGVRVEHDRSVETVFSHRYDAGGDVSGIPQEAPSRLDPEPHGVFLQKLAYGNAVCPRISKESFQEIGSNRPVVLGIHAGSEVKPMARFVFYARVVPVPYAISASNIDNAR